MFDIMDPETFWLNVTNIALGAGVLLCCLVLLHGLWQDLREKARTRSLAGIKQEAHTLLIPELGLTMADGGEKCHAGGQFKPRADGGAAKK